MNAVLHQIKWDFRRLRTPWLCWLLVLAVAALGANLTSLAGAPTTALAPLLTIVQTLGVFLFGTLLIARLMYATPFAGATAFWKTRPLTRRTLFWSKSVLIVLMLWLPVMVSKYVAWSASAPGSAFLVWSSLNFGAFVLAMFLVAATWSAICANSNYFMVAFAGTGAWAALCAIIFAQLASRTALFPVQLWNTSAPVDYSAINASTALLAFILLAAAALVAWWVGGRSNSPRAAFLAVGVIAFGVALATTAGPLWRINFFPQPRELAETELPVSVLAAGEDPGPGEHLLWSQLAVKVPPGHFASVRSASFLYEQDEPARRSSFSTDDRSANNLADQIRGLASYYPDRTTLLASEPKQRSSINRSLQNGTGTLEGAALLYLVKWRKVASLPLQRGARSRRSDLGTVSVHEIKETSNDLELEVESILPPQAFREFNPLQTHRGYPEPAAYVIHLPASDRAVVAEDHGYSSSVGIGASLATTRNRISFSKRLLLEPGQGLEDLPGATLDIYSMVPVATAHSKFKRENWAVYNSRMIDDTPDLLPPPPVIEVQDLPENPTAAQVEAYLDGILFTIPSNPGGEDWRQIEQRLLAIGSDHLEVLIRRLPVENYAEDLVYRVIRALLTDQHRSVLTETLEREPGLAYLFTERGWEEDAAPVLARLIRRHVPLDWRSAAPVVTLLARQKDPALFDDLRWHFVHSVSRHREMAAALAECPGFPLEEAIAELWSEARFELGGRRDQIAVLAARLGDKEALRDAFVYQTEQQDKNGFKLLAEAVDHEANDQLLDWIHDNFDALSFDEEKKVFVVR